MFVTAALLSMSLSAVPAPAAVEAASVPLPAAKDRFYPIQRLTPQHAGPNGRPWISRAMIGPGPTPQGRSCEVPGPAAYGAGEWDHQRVVVRVGQQLITISPWQRIEMPGLHWLERERINWLKIHGYASGVRTFRNDAYHAPEPRRPMHEAPKAPAHKDGGMMDEDIVTMNGTPAQHIEPRAVLRLPADAPRFRSKMRVMRPAVNSYELCSDRPGVETVRGEWNDGSVIKVLPIAAQAKAADPAPAKAEARAQPKTAAKPDTKPDPKPETLASAAK